MFLHLSQTSNNLSFEEGFCQVSDVIDLDNDSILAVSLQGMLDAHALSWSEMNDLTAAINNMGKHAFNDNVLDACLNELTTTVVAAKKNTNFCLSHNKGDRAVCESFSVHAHHSHTHLAFSPLDIDKKHGLP